MFYPLRRLLAATSLALLSPVVSAHTVWLEATDSATDYAVRFGGHAGVLEEYPPAKLTEVRAVGGAGEPIDVARQDLAVGVQLQSAEPASLLTLTFDNGIWSRLPNGRSENLPMDQVEGAESAVNAIKYHKYIARWDAQATQPQGQAFELVPLDVEAPAAGQPLRLKILINGQPTQGIALAFGEEGDDAVSDAAGVAVLTARRGVNRIWSGQRLEVADNPAYTQLSTEYSLVFHAQD
ncbi:DUF4198 domain-containing protein [Halopseudomonas maritima]|uniref:DUF4198 domain-containing protein n=1 Tax=Halopseudomonas maritima TaxID=2918528 RepID=UPI001EEC99A3|nr:DUF4198 domain-containing protein [Halopseudomonas maritima]UJJ30301.1 DUF4198 domain-containing protein [Halopseudomonas maritima]